MSSQPAARGFRLCRPAVWRNIRHPCKTDVHGSCGRALAVSYEVPDCLNSSRRHLGFPFIIRPSPRNQSREVQSLHPSPESAGPSGAKSPLDSPTVQVCHGGRSRSGRSIYVAASHIDFAAAPAAAAWSRTMQQASRHLATVHVRASMSR